MEFIILKKFNNFFLNFKFYFINKGHEDFFEGILKIFLESDLIGLVSYIDSFFVQKLWRQLATLYQLIMIL